MEKLWFSGKEHEYLYYEQHKKRKREKKSSKLIIAIGFLKNLFY